MREIRTAQKTNHVELIIEDEVYEAKVRVRTRREIEGRKTERRHWARIAREEREYA